MIRYVKREIRSLTISDREAVLDAMATLWKYSQGDGVNLFGPKYSSIDTLATAYSYFTSDVVCDSYQGPGFLSHYLALGVSFEAAIRAVDPSVTLPYWDYTIEGELMRRNNIPSFSFNNVSNILTSTWFGSSDENNHIMDGRWAHTNITKLSDDRYARSYWNNNPDPEITALIFVELRLLVRFSLHVQHTIKF